jgi:hypothetical protein
MAAPTNAAKREKISCQPGAVHTWHDLVAEDNLHHLVPSGAGFKEINQANRTAGPRPAAWEP